MLLRSGVRVALVEKSSGDPASAGRDFHGRSSSPAASGCSTGSGCCRPHGRAAPGA